MNGINLEYGDISETPEKRQDFAEDMWEICSDWNDVAIKILEKLLKPVSVQHAIARIVNEQKTFKHWSVHSNPLVRKHLKYKPFPYQVETIYEASYVIYEHGFVY